MRVLKDTILQRKKTGTPGQLFEFLIDDFDCHYADKLSDIANGRPSQYLRLKNNFKNEKLTNLEVTFREETGNVYKVRNSRKNKEYCV